MQRPVRIGCPSCTVSTVQYVPTAQDCPYTPSMDRNRYIQDIPHRNTCSGLASPRSAKEEAGYCSGRARTGVSKEERRLPYLYLAEALFGSVETEEKELSGVSLRDGRVLSPHHSLPLMSTCPKHQPDVKKGCLYSTVLYHARRSCTLAASALAKTNKRDLAREDKQRVWMSRTRTDDESGGLSRCAQLLYWMYVCIVQDSLPRTLAPRISSHSRPPSRNAAAVWTEPHTVHWWTHEYALVRSHVTPPINYPLPLQLHNSLHH